MLLSLIISLVLLSFGGGYFIFKGASCHKAVHLSWWNINVNIMSPVSWLHIPAKLHMAFVLAKFYKHNENIKQ